MKGCTVGGVTLPHGPYMIGAGVCKNPKTTKEWLKVASVVSGSYTPLPREGNQGKLFYPDTLEEVRRLGYGLNSFGMPNVGFVEAIKELSEIVSEQPLIVSIAGFSVADYRKGVETMRIVSNVSAIELNFGCPNTNHGEIASFKPNTISTILEDIVDIECNKPIWVKVSPYSNPANLCAAAEVLNEFKDELKLALVTCNTFPFAYAGKGKFDPIQGRAGLSGPALKHIALGQVHQFRELLDVTIDVIGVGGIMNGDDIIDFLDAGATAVQMTSWPFWAGNPGRFMDELTNSIRFFEYLELNHSEA